MFDTVQIVFEGSTKRYTYITDQPVGVGDLVEVDSPYSGRTAVRVVGTGGVEYTGSMKSIRRVIERTPQSVQAALGSIDIGVDHSQVKPDWAKEVFLVTNEKGEAARGRRWHDTQEDAEENARALLIAAHNERRPTGKLIILKAVSVIGLQEPAIAVKPLGTRKKRRRK